MARMSIDDMFLRDPRVLRLARACGWSLYETLGRLLHVYAIVYDRVDAGGSDVLQASDIDIAANYEGLSALMIQHELAKQTSNGVRIRGAKERTNYLATRKESGRLGGLKSGEARGNKAKVTLKVPAKVTFEKNEGPPNPSYSYSYPSADPIPNPTHTQNARARDGWEYVTEAERGTAGAILAKLSKHNGVVYTGSPQHVALIAERLRDGVSETDLRAVIAYCAVELGWENRDEMRSNLRPETLFHGEKITRWLDAARSWAGQLPEAGTSP
jgi:uncharacterized phage protein (TIGR02220 family)